MSRLLLTLNGIHKSFAGKPVIEDVSLSLKQGEITTLIGPNGAGKSTLAKIILGLIKPDSGTRLPNAELNIGYMPQKISIDPTLPISTCRFLQLANTSHQACHQALESVGIRHLTKIPIQRLSGGELQRALLARAILRNPNLLVLDEPVQGVDYTGEIALYELIKKISDTLNCGILLISHDLHTVMTATDHVVCLNGHVCCSGSPIDVAKNNEYKTLFGEQASQILSVYEHKHDHEHSDEGVIKKN